MKEEKQYQESNKGGKKMANQPQDEYERNMQYWIAQGKKTGEITYGMLCNGFQSIPGIPDEFYSAEDPKDREELWRAYQAKQNRHWNENEDPISYS